MFFMRKIVNTSEVKYYEDYLNMLFEKLQSKLILFEDYKSTLRGDMNKYLKIKLDEFKNILEPEYYQFVLNNVQLLITKAFTNNNSKVMYTVYEELKNLDISLIQTLPVFIAIQNSMVDQKNLFL
jgi:hypothetical protein